MKLRLFPGILIITLIGFMAFIVGIGLMFSQKDMSLVVKDYYKEEVKYQQTINQLGNVALLQDTFRIAQHGELLLLDFPADFTEKEMIGEIHLFRPSDASMDMVVPFNPGALQQVVPVSGLAPGLWRLKISWKSEDIAYYHEKKIMLK